MRKQFAAGTPRDGRMDPRVSIAIEIAAQDLRQTIRLSELANSVGLSVSRFHELFHLNTGSPPGHYFRLMRLDRARDLLVSSPVSIKEVSYIVGYSDRSHFEREYKKLFGVTPRTCRFCALSVGAEGAKRTIGCPGLCSQRFGHKIR